jgi:D-glycero-D-manno-heptose 1,7-bisphosphate phosphatase
MNRPVAFLDRDGTVIRDEHYLADPARVRLIDGAPAAIARLRAAGIAVVIVTNQSGIARGCITPAQYDAVRTRLDALLADAGAPVDATYHCPHHPDVDGPCDCRKPGPALYRQAMADLGLDATKAAFVGDRWSDTAAAAAFGGLGLLVPSPDTPPADIARATAAGTLAVTLSDAADRILEALAWPPAWRRA